MLISSENTRREISTFAVFFIQSLVTNLSFFGIILLLGFGYLPNLQKSLHHGAAAHSRAHHGRMAEWLIVPPWKGGIRKFRQDFLYRRHFEAAVRRGHKLGHKKPKMPPIWIVLVRGFLSIRNLQMCASLWRLRAAFRSQRQPMRAGFGQKS